MVAFGKFTVIFIAALCCVSVEAGMKEVLINAAKWANKFTKGFRISNVHLKECPNFQDPGALDLSFDKTMDLNRALFKRMIKKDERICIQIDSLALDDIHRRNWYQRTSIKLVGQEVDLSDWGRLDTGDFEKGEDFINHLCIDFPSYTPSGSYKVVYHISGHMESQFDHADPEQPSTYIHTEEDNEIAQLLGCVEMEFKVSKA